MTAREPRIRVADTSHSGSRPTVSVAPDAGRAHAGAPAVIHQQGAGSYRPLPDPGRQRSGRHARAPAARRLDLPLRESPCSGLTPERHDAKRIGDHSSSSTGIPLAKREAERRSSSASVPTPIVRPALDATRRCSASSTRCTERATSVIVARLDGRNRARKCDQVRQERTDARLIPPVVSGLGERFRRSLRRQRRRRLRRSMIGSGILGHDLVQDRGQVRRNEGFPAGEHQ